MKYGQKLQQRSIPAWSAYNIDYDDVKRYIKAQTSTAQRRASAPRISDDKLQQTEDHLFVILDEQHRRIDLFVKSKTREIQHRLNDAKKRLRLLAARQPPPEVRLSAARLERYSRLENDVLKAGEEIRSLARFTGAQKTGFGKLLKKYKKWSGSTALEDRFREEILNDSKSFTKHDLGPLLDEYSETLHNIRALYASRLAQSSGEVQEADSSYLIGSSINPELLSSVASKRRVDFDTAIATVPVGETGKHATYFVHPENVVELQVLLMQHLNFHMARSRQNSAASPITSQGGNDMPQQVSSEESADYFWLGADDTDRFADEQRNFNIVDCEARMGSTPQRSRFSARWTSGVDDEALIAGRVGETHVQVSKLRRKHIDSFFAKSSSFPARRASMSITKHLDELNAIRTPYAGDENAKPLFLMSSHRTRFVGLNNTSKHVVLATLDTGITLGPWEGEGTSKRTGFPYAVLIVRQEGTAEAADGVIDLLDQSHLVERVQGFSMEYQAIWQVCRPSSMIKPFWTPLLNHDIRKLPPPALKHGDTATTSSTLVGSSSGPETSTGSASVIGTATDSTTAVETGMASELEVPPLKAFRKKRKRAFPEGPVRAQERYWSEYDHPEDGEGGDAYVIYIDPDEKSSFDRMVDSVSSWFRPRKPADDEERLLSDPSTPREDESSSDEEGRQPARSRNSTNYGSILRHRHNSATQRAQTPAPFLPQPTVSCLAASAVILVIGYILAATGRHKQVTEVQAGLLFAFASSVLFIVAGVVMLARARAVQQLGVAVAVTAILAESVAAGGLLAHTIG